MDPLTRPAVVVDCGSGYTKLGFAGSVHPAAVIPTVIACSASSQQQPWKQADSLSDLDVIIGEEAYASSAAGYTIHNPIRQGVVENWDHMERFWHHCFWQQLCVDPQDHLCALTEPALNTPDNRECTAEIMFETFGVPGLYIEVQALMALCASCALESSKKGDTNEAAASSRLTGTVIDVGEGTTSIVPVVDGFVLAGSIKTLPLTGRDVTLLVQQMLRERGEPIPPEQSMEVARTIKETMSYTCGDMAKEMQKFKENPAKYQLQYTGVHARTGKEFVAEVGYERFLGPEMFFSPDVYATSSSPSLPRAVDSVIQSCPIDTRRSLYGNIVLSGGSTMFKNFDRRLQRDLAAIANSRITPEATPLEVRVVAHSRQRNASWLGCSIITSQPQHQDRFITQEKYHEHGPSICRSNYMFKDA